MARGGGGFWEEGQGWGLMLSVKLCLSSALRVLHRSFHGECTGTDYHRLERERGRKSGVWGGAGPGFVVRR